MSDEAFLSRWSRLKRASAPPPDPAPPTPEPPVAAALVETDGEAPTVPPDEAADPLADLPSVEDLTAESDFTPFLRADVPEDLHRQALRKLWTSDPVYANDDGLKDYADDYTGLFDLSEPVKTLYRVGRGFLTDDPESPETPLQASPSPPRGEGRGEGEASQNVSTEADSLPPPVETPLADSVLAADPPHPSPLPGGATVFTQIGLLCSRRSDSLASED
ncbi:DUF3306 domain-containing protein [Azospirillum sp.]|uniref:DUF3306 domain-containing protein n=1 Tax=Azospirillum sp. TaxID=34012 RepID=UPI0026116852|nr:DUF3306 domain-containing protein [Azospirillum sp.]